MLRRLLPSFSCENATSMFCLQNSTSLAIGPHRREALLHPVDKINAPSSRLVRGRACVIWFKFYTPARGTYHRLAPGESSRGAGERGLRNDVVLRTNDVVLRANDVVLRTNDVTLHANDVALCVMMFA